MSAFSLSDMVTVSGEIVASLQLRLFFDNSIMFAFSLSDILGLGEEGYSCVIFAFSLFGMVTASREASTSTEGIALCLRSRFLTY